jgi:hypothetical protein
VKAPPSEADQERILDEAAARLSLLRFEEEALVSYPPAAAEAFVRGYRDGERGAALERAVEHHRLRCGDERLAAFAYGWCRGRADLLGHRPVYVGTESWLSRRVSAGARVAG